MTEPGNEQLPLIGRDRFIIQKLAKHFYDRAGRPTTKLAELPRGNEFRVQLDDGYVARVTVVLDSILAEEER
jgi:hypothetical protein